MPAIWLALVNPKIKVVTSTGCDALVSRGGTSVSSSDSIQILRIIINKPVSQFHASESVSERNKWYQNISTIKWF